MRVLLLIFILTSHSIVLFAQDIQIVKDHTRSKLKPSSMTFLSWGPSLGQNISDGEMMIFGDLSLNHIREDKIFSLKYLLGTEIGFFSGNSLAVNEISALYGLVSKAKFGYASISAGLGYVEVTSRGNYSYGYGYGYHQASTVGISLEAQAFANLFIVGIGAKMFVNINPELVYGGFGIHVQIGDLMNEYHN